MGINTLPAEQGQIADLEIPLDRDVFLRTLIRELSGTLEEVIGLQQASGFISVVGQAVGDQINDQYKAALDVPSLSRSQVVDVLIDLKRRIQGDFFVVEQDDRKVVLKNRACPLAEKVRDRKSICMMTSNVFGLIAAENLGYAKVELQQTIAEGDPECRVVLHLTPDSKTDASEGQEYYRSVL